MVIGRAKCYSLRRPALIIPTGSVSEPDWGSLEEAELLTLVHVCVVFLWKRTAVPT